jgi:hypothetical protein
MSVTVQDQTAILTRIASCRRALRDILAEGEHEQERRNVLIRQAINEGTSFRTVGLAAGLTPGGVAKVLSKPPPGE